MSAGELSFPSDASSARLIPHAFSTTTMNRKAGGTGPHIHQCIARSLQKEAQAIVEASYEPHSCRWNDCRNRTRHQNFPSHRERAKHIHGHIDTSVKSPADGCQWRLFASDQICGEVDILDWGAHFAEEHAINIREVAQVEYCFITNNWYVFLLSSFLYNFPNHFFTFVGFLITLVATLIGTRTAKKCLTTCSFPSRRVPMTSPSSPSESAELIIPSHSSITLGSTASNRSFMAMLTSVSLWSLCSVLSASTIGTFAWPHG